MSAMLKLISRMRAKCTYAFSVSPSDQEHSQPQLKEAVSANLVIISANKEVCSQSLTNVHTVMGRSSVSSQTFRAGLASVGPLLARR